jgi:uncharacterized protein
MRIAAIALALVSICYAQLKRPQRPQPPFPYRIEELTIPSKAPGIALACTLTVPAGDGGHPAILLVTGSGPQDRDETVFGHKPFLLIADYLTRRGIAVLRCDDRGTGKSTGRFLGATTADFSLDAEGAFSNLLKRPEVTKAGIGGHSEGANIAAMVASRRRDVAFVVMLAGTGVNGEQVGYTQAAAIQRARGMTDEEIQRHQKMVKTLIALARSGATPGELLRQAREKYHAIPDAERIAMILADPWHRASIDYDPAPIMAKVKCPVLVLNGDLDLQVVADVNVPAIQSAFRKGGNQQVTVRRFPKLNHLFQTAATGLPDEYQEIDETMAPVVLESIASWLGEVAK